MVDIIRDYEKIVKSSQLVFAEQEILKIAPLSAGQKTELNNLRFEQQKFSDLELTHETQEYVAELIPPLRLILIRIMNRLKGELYWAHPLQARLLTEFVDKSSVSQLYTNLNQTIQMNLIYGANLNWKQNALRLTPPLTVQMGIMANNLKVRTEFSELLLPGISLDANPRDLVKIENESNQIAIKIAIATHVNHLKHMLAGLIPNQFEILNTVDVFEYLGNTVYQPIYEFIYKEVLNNNKKLSELNISNMFSPAFVTAGLVINAKNYLANLQNNAAGELKALYADAYLEFKANLPKIGGENIFDTEIPKLYKLTFRELTPFEKEEYYFANTGIDIYAHPELAIAGDNQVLLSSGIITLSEKAYDTFNQQILTEGERSLS